MGRYLEATAEVFPVAGSFTISRGSRTEVVVVACSITENGVRGVGECVPYTRYGESIDGVLADIRAVSDAASRGLDRSQLQHVMKPGAARNAVDCALWDLETKLSGTSVASKVLTVLPKPIFTAYTISLGEPTVMAAKAAENAMRPLLKIKAGTQDDEARLRAVRAAAPQATIIVDANEGWTEQNIEHHFAVAKDLNIALIEQPLPVGKDGILSRIERPVAICADESVHLTADLAALRDRYDAINIKLDKTGGLTEALVMKREAERLGYTIMVGCMLGTSLGMAPALMLAQDTAYADLDGPLLLARDRVPSLRYEGSLVHPPEPELWG
ncbi:N-acetyl-D-Glu racemase DgcA [Agrobacterium rosae]|uniref:Dipeptide epimerase n=1 Tax=Agrobacterium rosae TaxID=1972867 RepID=A0AAE5RWF8_9HYPH|nr:N-acetyl-D-Glu racemase DgcA [Agrobacterium rosae]KAA3509935.1 dipeptide epimerase [Agrobacterium rosae]KAA3515118.1 dipeptide epimerase [Agrobacterium rosae]MCM2433147.1 dipeptide epimerase [Agrobacterium rosae]MDX8331478.1 N-acetyl-D-Glu racemase DgcA [Agrobacterium rosae]MQB50532.1 dipeptide epimerase [Agrobacterium rosae]